MRREFRRGRRKGSSQGDDTVSVRLRRPAVPGRTL